jgi:serine/threonine protein kinase
MDALAELPPPVSSVPAPSLSAEPGTLIDGLYRVTATLGQGGMGLVIRARDERLERDVAIKLIRPELVDDTLRARFLTEARAMARVHHPNVLPIYAFGESQSTPYLVTELVDGQTVEHWLRARPVGTAPDLEIALRILEGTCNGVAAIHAADTVHRDLKPSNLLLDADFRVRVADMGIADLLQRVRAERGTVLVGTPEYMAPENVLQVDIPPELVRRADVYSLGCLAFELLTGTPPYSGANPVERMLAHVTAEIPLPSLRNPRLGTDFDDLVVRALAKDPAERTPSAEAFGRALAAVRKKEFVPTRILVAEDDDDFRDALEIALRNAFPDALIECVADGQAAVDAFDQRHHSVAILDLQMPLLDGIQVTELLRARAGTETVAIVVVTASGGPAEWKHLSAIGADGFFLKPVNLKDIITLVRRALGDRAHSIVPLRA